MMYSMRDTLRAYNRISLELSEMQKKLPYLVWTKHLEDGEETTTGAVTAEESLSLMSEMFNKYVELSNIISSQNVTSGNIERIALVKHLRQFLIPAYKRGIEASRPTTQKSRRYNDDTNKSEAVTIQTIPYTDATVLKGKMNELKKLLSATQREIDNFDAITLVEVSFDLDEFLD